MGFKSRAQGPKQLPMPFKGLPVAQKTDLFKELYIETIIRNPKKVGLFGYGYGLRLRI